MPELLEIRAALNSTPTLLIDIEAEIDGASETVLESFVAAYDRQLRDLEERQRPLILESEYLKRGDTQGDPLAYADCLRQLSALDREIEHITPLRHRARCRLEADYGWPPERPDADGCPF